MENLPSWLNPFDFLIGFALLGGTALGFIRGMVRMALGLVVWYVAAILAMNFYGVVGDWILYLTDYRADQSVSEAVGFLLILLVVAAVLHFVLSRTYKDTEWPGIRQIDQLGGLVLGFFLTSLWIGLVLLGLSFILGTAGVGSENLRQNLLSYFRNSALIPIFYSFLPIAFATLKPWLPKGQLPDIFTFRLY